MRGRLGKLRNVRRRKSKKWNDRYAKTSNELRRRNSGPIGLGREKERDQDIEVDHRTLERGKGRDIERARQADHRREEKMDIGIGIEITNEDEKMIGIQQIEDIAMLGKTKETTVQLLLELRGIDQTLHLIPTMNHTTLKLKERKIEHDGRRTTIGKLVRVADGERGVDLHEIEESMACKTNSGGGER